MDIDMYLLFAGDYECKEIGGGANDLVGVFHTLTEARAAYDIDVDNETAWAHILCLDPMEIVSYYVDGKWGYPI